MEISSQGYYDELRITFQRAKVLNNWFASIRRLCAISMIPYFLRLIGLLCRHIIRHKLLYENERDKSIMLIHANVSNRGCCYGRKW